MSQLFEADTKAKPVRQRVNGHRANDLDGAEWTRNSISVWNDIRKDKEELDQSKLHPAIFPKMLVTRILRSFTNKTERVVLDPFMGSGSTIIAALKCGKYGVGFEVYQKFIEVAEQRLQQMDVFVQHKEEKNHRFVLDDARNCSKYLDKNSVDIVVTSPPYWDILSQKRSADYKETRDYGEHETDLATIHSYEDFLERLVQVFDKVRDVLKPGKYCVVNVMDLRKKDRFYPYHSDLAQRMEKIGFIWDDLIIWDRNREYNNIRPLGFPSVFRINKVHEYILVFQKPKIQHS